MDPRRRAPHREGTRTTLKVPDEVQRAAADLARELGTTTNDATIRLAELGAEEYRRRKALADVVRERSAAIGATGLPDLATFPSPEELQAAMLAARSDS